MGTNKSRRSRRLLENEIEHATDQLDRARAHYELALFLDNNSREAEAIPNYQAALASGLDGEKRAECRR